MILYCFISHGSVVISDYLRIKTMMDKLNYNEYCIVYGGDKSIENDHIKHIECRDGYCDLPEKINKTIKHISKIKKYTYIFKSDRTGIVTRLFSESKLSNIDYGGNVFLFQNPKYHFSKCEKKSKWYNKPFNGKKVKYCCGGGYILSKKAANIIALNDSYAEHVYEDYYVGSILKQNDISPIQVDIKNYFYDPEHPNLFK